AQEGARPSAESPPRAGSESAGCRPAGGGSYAAPGPTSRESGPGSPGNVPTRTTQNRPPAALRRRPEISGVPRQAVCSGYSDIARAGCSTVVLPAFAARNGTPAGGFQPDDRAAVVCPPLPQLVFCAPPEDSAACAAPAAARCGPRGA